LTDKKLLGKNIPAVVWLIFQSTRSSKMLILTRRVGEALNIGDEVQVTILGIKGNQVRVGINAPLNIPVHREEIYEKIKQEQATKGTQAGVQLTLWGDKYDRLG